MNILNKFIYRYKFTPIDSQIDVDLSNLKTVISFSLYGNVEKYIGGLIENCRNINSIYPSFWIYIYLGNDFDKSIMNGKFDNIKNILFIETEKSGHEVACYRFFTIDNPDVGIAFSRDADSRINARDQYCINEFFKSSKKFQIIRDHPHHGTEILAGMWGIKKGLNINFKDEFEKYKSNRPYFIYGSDQSFLAYYIYPKVRDHSLIFDEYFRYPNEVRNRIVNTTEDKEFVGAQVYLFHKPN